MAESATSFGPQLSSRLVLLDTSVKWGVMSMGPLFLALVDLETWVTTFWPRVPQAHSKAGIIIRIAGWSLKAYNSCEFMRSTFKSPKVILLHLIAAVLFDLGLCTHAAIVELEAAKWFYSALVFCLIPSILAVCYGTYALRMTMGPSGSNYEPTVSTWSGMRPALIEQDSQGPLSLAFQAQQTHQLLARDRSERPVYTNIPIFTAAPEQDPAQWLSSLAKCVVGHDRWREFANPRAFLDAFRGRLGPAVLEWATQDPRTRYRIEEEQLVLAADVLTVRDAFLEAWMPLFAQANEQAEVVAHADADAEGISTFVPGSAGRYLDDPSTIPNATGSYPNDLYVEPLEVGQSERSSGYPVQLQFEIRQRLWNSDFVNLVCVCLGCSAISGILGYVGILSMGPVRPVTTRPGDVFWGPIYTSTGKSATLILPWCNIFLAAAYAIVSRSSQQQLGLILCASSALVLAFMEILFLFVLEAALKFDDDLDQNFGAWAGGGLGVAAIGHLCLYVFTLVELKRRLTGDGLMGAAIGHLCLYVSTLVEVRRRLTGDDLWARLH